MRAGISLLKKCPRPRRSVPPCPALRQAWRKCVVRCGPSRSGELRMVRCGTVVRSDILVRHAARPGRSNEGLHGASGRAGKRSRERIAKAAGVEGTGVGHELTHPRILGNERESRRRIFPPLPRHHPTGRARQYLTKIGMALRTDTKTARVRGHAGAALARAVGARRG